MPLISDKMKAMNEELHKNKYGTGGGSWAGFVVALVETMKWGGDQFIHTVLDYGCGRGYLKVVLDKMNVNFSVSEYDPCVEGKTELPSPADLVMVTDVMEHIEENCLDEVLRHIYSLTRLFCFMIIAMTPSNKTLSDGSNAHQIQKSQSWWTRRLQLMDVPFIPMPVHNPVKYCAFLISKVSTTNPNQGGQQ